jgi:cell wall-associated NlpC family hydrolase
VTLRRTLIAPALLAASLVVGIPASALAQGATFSRAEKPFTTISRMFAKPAPTDSVVTLAKSQLGTRYKLGAKAPGKAFDCSGLVQWVMAAFNLELPRTSREQAKAGIEVPKDPTKLLPGDLLYFGKGKSVTHIGIYVGEGRYVHASNPKTGVIEAPLPTGKRAQTWWKGARRLFDEPTEAPPITFLDSLLVRRTTS